jgi:hypothetical protein
MDPLQRVAFIRVAIVSAAWALGEALVWQLQVAGLGLIVPAVLAAAAYVGTRDLSAYRGRDDAYWRGRRIDRDRWH